MANSDWLSEIEGCIGRLSPLQKVLLGTDGSVTRLLELATGFPVEIRTLLQEVVPADHIATMRLECQEGEPVNHRVVELRSTRTGEVLIHAISDTPVSRLSSAIRDDLMRADIPIGRILQAHRIESRREITRAWVHAPDASSSGAFPSFPVEPLLSREYRIIHNGAPLIAIQETFPCHAFRDRQRVITESPSRLHLGLIDLNGGLGRVDGGIGITLREPRIILWTEEASTIQVEGGDAGCRDVIRRAAEATISALQLPGAASFRLQTWYPRHIGLGSGTQLGLAAAHSLCVLYKYPRTVRELAMIVGRGGTSGIGTAAFETGGFIIDGGHSFGTNGGKTGFLPSAASRGVIPASVTVHHPFPEAWKILLVIPSGGETVSGRREQDLFSGCCPVPEADVREICHEILMRLLPGLVEEDLDLFGAAVNRIQQLGFKKAEREMQPQAIRDLLFFLEEAGAPAYGMSSFGPVLFAIGDTGMVDLEKTLREFMDGLCGGTTLLSGGRNSGAVVRTIPQV